MDKIKGGLADNKTLEDIAEKHNVSVEHIKKQLKLGIEVEHEHTDDSAKAEEIAKDHLWENPDYYDKLAEVEKTNAKDYAKVYHAANFIEKGVCTYKEETIYISQETLNKAMHTMKGRPVVIKHQKVTPENMEEHAVGYVFSANFNSIDASFGCDFIISDDEGKNVISKDYSVSCAYKPLAFAQGGTWHNTPYDREVTELEFTHLALVPDPRYEDAKIYENSKNEEDNKETYNMEKVEVEQGFLASLMGMAGQFLNSKKEEDAEHKKHEAKETKEEEKKENEDDDKLEHEGEIYSKKELVNCYKDKMNEMKEKEEKESKEKEEKEKENAKEEKEGEEFFNSMKQKMENKKVTRVKPETERAALERGKSIYGG